MTSKDPRCATCGEKLPFDLFGVWFWQAHIFCSKECAIQWPSSAENDAVDTIALGGDEYDVDMGKGEG